MLTKKQNFLETIRGGNPDRFVNQYEALALLFFVDPIATSSPMASPGAGPIVNAWGVTSIWPEGMPGPMPVHDEEHIVLKDITKWKEVVKAPNVIFPEEAWAATVEAAAAIDRNEQFVTIAMAPGVFEQLHYLMSMEECLVNFYEEPEAMHELIDYITEHEIRYAEQLIKYVKPDALFHHDDWGSHNSSFISPDMFREFILPAYKKIYAYHKANGVEVIVHHSDSYAANLVPQMIEMGVDVFQGCVTTNDVPALVREFGGQISFMGDLNNGVIDVHDWTPELVRREVERACRNNGKHYFIPCLTMGGPMSSYPGVYEAVTEEIDRMSAEMF